MTSCKTAIICILSIITTISCESELNNSLFEDDSKIKSENYTNTPVLFWHGMGDSCCFPFSLGYLKKLTEQELNNTVYVKSLEIGGSLIRDYESSYFIHPNAQIEDACNQVKNDPILNSTRFNAVGFSQGSQFLRGLIQRCPEAKVKNLITFGGQHQGVFGLPNCPSLTGRTCNYIRKLLNLAAYTTYMQRILVQATYWHSPLEEDAYRKKSSFLADINNELNINEAYIQRLQSIDKFVMIMFRNDTIVDPAETSHFGFYKPGSDREKITLEESELFIKDKLGLQKMKADGKLVFEEIDGNHMQINKNYFIEKVINGYLRD